MSIRRTTSGGENGEKETEENDRQGGKDDKSLGQEKTHQKENRRKENRRREEKAAQATVSAKNAKSVAKKTGAKKTGKKPVTTTVPKPAAGKTVAAPPGRAYRTKSKARSAAVVDIFTDAERLHHKLEPDISNEPEYKSVAGACQPHVAA